jgi:lysozyme family protein
MKRIDRYNEHLLEKEFKSIVASILLIAEAQTSDNTFEWDLREPKRTFNFKDKKEFEVGDTIVFDMEQKKKLKDYIDFVKNKAKNFKNYLNEPDPEVDFVPAEKLKELLKKIVASAPTKEEAFKKVKEYFDRFVLELKSLPYEIKRSLIKKFVYIFLVFIPLINLIPDTNIATQDASMLKDIRTEVEGKTKSKPDKVYSSFEIAQEGVHKIEGVYTADRDDKGNWTGNEIGAGTLLGTKYGIAAPTLVDYYQRNDLGVPTVTDMENLTYEKALEIYKKDYWAAQNLHKFKSQSLANVLYDGCVNQGPGATLGILTESLEEVDIPSDNINNWNEFHEVLTDEVNELPTKDTKKLFETIKEKRWEKYQEGKAKYQEGWKNRLDAITFIDNDTEQSDIA